MEAHLARVARQHHAAGPAHTLRCAKNASSPLRALACTRGRLKYYSAKVHSKIAKSLTGRSAAKVFLLVLYIKVCNGLVL